MSSDFESLSCDLESIENRWHDSLSDLDVLDEAAGRERTPPRRHLTARASVPRGGDRYGLPLDTSGRDTREHRWGVPGNRDGGVTNEVNATFQVTHGDLRSKRSETQPRRRGDGGYRVLPTEEESPMRGSRCPPATIARGSVKSRMSLDNLQSALAATVVSSRDARIEKKAAPATLGQATCPPDSGTLTPVTSAATTSPCLSPRHTRGSPDGDGNACDDDYREAEEEAGRANLDDPEKVPHGRLACTESGVAISSKPLSLPLPRRSARDSDGFYNTSLLQDDDDDDDDDENDAHESDLCRRHAAVANSAAVPRLSAAFGASPPHQHGNDALISCPRVPVTNEDKNSHPSQFYECPALALSAGAPTVSTPRCLSIASRRNAAADELCRLAVMLPTMSITQWLSLVITLLVPVNLLCLDLMALGWIRRHVDTSYGDPSSALPSPGQFTSSTSSRVGNCCSAVISTRVQAASSLSCANDSKSISAVGATTVSSTPIGAERRCGIANAGNSGKDDASNSSSSSAHTVPAFCSVILWLLAPNGLLCRLVIHRLRRSHVKAAADGREPQSEPVTDSPRHRAPVAEADEFHDLRTEWQELCDVYERVRQLAPQLEVIQLFIRYACLLIMVHAALPCATAVSEWADTWLLKGQGPEEEKASAHITGSGRAETDPANAAAASSSSRRTVKAMTAT
ncbi:hypothetical protein JKF63_07742 [Porcisia hertigi]|uniref:Uncharacterized protein n=1 Tax=Porcisia hertigi TaxID=2761500 RepID=A0A836LLU6_9TRYP|nr:hypothetical protein JKF63_07742 [Porcisia hertigi]